MTPWTDVERALLRVSWETYPLFFTVEALGRDVDDVLREGRRLRLPRPDREEIAEARRYIQDAAPSDHVADVSNMVPERSPEPEPTAEPAAEPPPPPPAPAMSQNAAPKVAPFQRLASKPAAYRLSAPSLAQAALRQGSPDAASPAPPTPALRPIAPRITLERRTRACQWPTGPDLAEPCGDPALHGYPYCEGHCRRAYANFRNLKAPEEQSA